MTTLAKCLRSKRKFITFLTRILAMRSTPLTWNLSTRERTLMCWFWLIPLTRFCSSKWANTKARSSCRLSLASSRSRKIYKAIPKTQSPNLILLPSPNFPKTRSALSAFGCRANWRNPLVKSPFRGVWRAHLPLFLDRCPLQCAWWCKWWNSRTHKVARWIIANLQRTVLLS